MAKLYATQPKIQTLKHLGNDEIIERLFGNNPAEYEGDSTDPSDSLLLDDETDLSDPEQLDTLNAQLASKKLSVYYVTNEDGMATLFRSISHQLYRIEEAFADIQNDTINYIVHLINLDCQKNGPRQF